MRCNMFLKGGAPAGRIEAAGADLVILDLEDSVASTDKERIRQWIDGLLESGACAARPTYVRVNALSDRAELERDLDLCLHPHIDGLMLPMLERASDVEAFGELVSLREEKIRLAPRHTRFICLIETPAAVLDADAIAAASERTIALAFGHGDFLKCTRGDDVPESLLAARSTVVMAARAHGLAPIATPFLRLDSPRKFKRECQRMKQLGFSGILTLHPDQNSIAAQVFSPSPAEVLRARAILQSLESSKAISVLDGAMLGPPMKDWALEVVRQAGEDTLDEAPACDPTDALSATAPAYGLDLTEARPGQVLESPYELTVDDSWRTVWQTTFHASSCIETSEPYARACGFDGRPLPYSLLLNLTLCMSVEPFSESCRLHLGLREALMERPAYAGDTFRNVVRIDELRNTSRGDRSVIQTTHVLVNQRGERVFSLKKDSYFSALEGLEDREPTVCDRPEFERQGGRAVRDVLLSATSIPSAPGAAPLAAGELLLHPPVRPIGWTENLALTTLFRNTHPLHFDTQRHEREDILVCGGFVQSLALAATGRELRQVVHEEIVRSSHVNPVAPEDRIGAVSRVLRVRAVSDELEEVELKTLGLKNTDVIRELDGRALPRALFSERSLRPSQIEDVCARHCPELSGKIAVQVLRTILRVRD